MPKDQLAITGSSVVLTCNVTGAPSVQYVWLKDQNVLDASLSSKYVCVFMCSCVCVCVRVCVCVCVCVF